MKETDQYHKWIEWSEEDQAYIGECPDLVTGIHGEDPIKLYAELCEVIEDVVRHFEREGRTLPGPRIRLMQEVAYFDHATFKIVRGDFQDSSQTAFETLVNFSGRARMKAGQWGGMSGELTITWTR